MSFFSFLFPKRVSPRDEIRNVLRRTKYRTQAEEIADTMANDKGWSTYYGLLRKRYSQMGLWSPRAAIGWMELKLSEVAKEIVSAIIISGVIWFPIIPLAEANEPPAVDRLHVDTGFSAPLYQATDDGIVKVGSGTAAIGLSYSIYTGRQWSLELGAAYGMRVVTDGLLDARDPVVGPTLGVGYDSVAALKAWGVWMTEQAVDAPESYAVGILIDVRLQDALEVLDDIFGASVLGAFADLAKEY